MTNQVVKFLDPATGSQVLYKRYGARLKTFLEEYSPKDGYRVEVSFTDLLSLQKGRLSLLREAVVAGKKPADVGLPAIEDDIHTLVCTAQLLDSQDRMIRSASASMRVVEFKDYEELETAANQRLLAALGFGGTEFDGDENRGIKRQGLSLTEQPPASPPAASTSGAAKASDHFDSDDVLPFTQNASTAAATGSEDDKPITEAERRQIANLANRLAVPVPELRTRKDARNARNQLSEHDRQRRSSQSKASAASGTV